VASSTTSVGTVEDLEASAARITSLTDFGGDEYREGLAVLLDAYARDEELTELGRKVKRSELRGALMARLISQAGFAQVPVDDAVLHRPIFVTGLPRTGTTALHRLLAADPRHQGLEQWLCEVPQPRPPRETWAADPVFRQIQAGFDRFYEANPGFGGVHYIAADTVEECWQLLRQSAMSVSYESLSHVPSYSTWLSAQDWTPAYRRHRRNLALIGAHEPDKRWVLKNPSHLFALDALFAVYPDAIVVQTHRPMRTTLASSCSLSALATRGHSTRFVGDTIGRDQLDLLGRGADLTLAGRAKHDPSAFYDVNYRAFVSDPVGTVEAIYRHFALPWDASVRAAIEAEDTASRSGHRAPAHRYELADFGVTDGEVDERFAEYTERFLPSQG
jgi:Sulfotransferase family